MIICVRSPLLSKRNSCASGCFDRRAKTSSDMRINCDLVKPFSSAHLLKSSYKSSGISTLNRVIQTPYKETVFQVVSLRARHRYSTHNEKSTRRHSDI